MRTRVAWLVVVCLVLSVGCRSPRLVIQRLVLTLPKLGMVLVPIEPGSFRMGSNRGDTDEHPVHLVRISRRFWMGRTEVTQAEYRAVTGKAPSHFKGKTKPVESVSWDDAIRFCDKLTKREWRAGRLPRGYVLRLPTEAEWEYCCRAGTRRAYSWGNRLGEGNCNAENDEGSDDDGQCDYFTARGLSVDSTMNVGQCSANAWGLYDMHGNVWEWCHDWYADRYPSSAAADPVGPTSGSTRVFRGGGWCSSADNCRSATRDGRPPSFAHHGVGFRVVLAPALPRRMKTATP